MTITAGDVTLAGSSTFGTGARRSTTDGMLALTLVPTNRFERAAAILVIFFLAHSMPQVWFTPVASAYTTTGSARTMQFLLVAGVAIFGLASTRFAVAPFLQLARQEVFLPLFLVLIMLSTFWSSAPLYALQQSIFLGATTMVGYWLIVRFPLREIVGAAAVAFAVGLILQLAMVKVLPEYSASDKYWLGFFKNRNVFGRHLSLALLVFLFAARVHRRFRLPLYAMVGLTVFALLHTDSRTSVVVCIAMPLMIMVFVAFRARRTLYGAVAVVMAGAATSIVLFTFGNLSTVTESLDRNPTLTGRTEIWAEVWPYIWQRPIVGWGWGGFFTDWFGPARGVYLRMGQTSHAHNALLQYALSLGVIGAALALAFFVRLIVRGARVVRYYRGALGMFPLVYAGYVLLNSISELGVIDQPDAHYLFLVVAISAATPGRRDVLARTLVTAAPPLLASSSSLRRPLNALSR